jgi:hypothetical protein
LTIERPSCVLERVTKMCGPTVAVLIGICRSAIAAWKSATAKASSGPQGCAQFT